MKKAKGVCVPFLFALVSIIALVWFLDQDTIPGANAASHTVCTAGPPACDFNTIQAAAAEASDGDIIKVASGIYADIHTMVAPPDYPNPPTNTLITQVLYINTSIAIIGGYTTTNNFAEPPDPVANPTTLDAQGQGRGILIVGNINPTIEGLRITGGNANGLGGTTFGVEHDGGGGIHIISATAVFHNNHVFSNTVTNEQGAWGGGMFLLHSPATVSENTFSTNTASWHGAGLYVYESNVLLTDNTIAGNLGSYALTVIHGDQAQITGNTISGNQGRGMYLYGTAPVSGNTISGNRGGVELHDGTLIDNMIVSNVISSTDPFSDWNNGGGVRADSGILIGNTILSNTAVGGGGVFVPNGPVTLTDNIISGNSATGLFGGGGVYVDGDSSVTFMGNTISENYGERGSGILLSADTLRNESIWQTGELSGDITLIGNIITNNDGDGIYQGDSYYYSTLINNIITNNGDGVVIRDGRLLHNTIARNDRGIYLENGNVAITNTIVASNTVGVEVNGATLSLEATLWGAENWANETDWINTGGSIVSGTINIWGDPAFVNPDAGDYHIGSASDAIDVGIDAGVQDDIDGQTRPIGEGYDIGADEFQDQFVIYLPILIKP